MTVCIAAMANVPGYPTIVAASDRAITTGDQVYEGVQTKRYLLDLFADPAHIVALCSGDVFDTTAVVTRAIAEICETKLQLVSAVAECFARHYRGYRREVYEREFLSPHGLTWETYHEGGDRLPPDLVESMKRGVRERWLPISERDFGCSTIIAGVDKGSNPLVEEYITAHIYVIKDPGQVLCADTIGFAAIGEGAVQAESYLMIEQYTSGIGFNDATITVYSAKRNAERAPHVGPGTDLVRIDWTGMGYAREFEFRGIEKIYQADLQRKRKSVARARQQMSTYMDGLNATPGVPELPPQSRPAGQDTESVPEEG